MEGSDQEQRRRLIVEAPFIDDIGIEFTQFGGGRAESRLAIEPRHLQQNGFVHAGVLGTMADHTAGGAAFTLVDPGMAVLTVEYKLNLLRPARGDHLRCAAAVLKPGRTITVAESEIYARSETEERMVAKATVTLAVVPVP